jgi:hypothetical protein
LTHQGGLREGLRERRLTFLAGRDPVFSLLLQPSSQRDSAAAVCGCLLTPGFQLVVGGREIRHRLNTELVLCDSLGCFMRAQPVELSEEPAPQATGTGPSSSGLY